jgi:hypothetical protein
MHEEINTIVRQINETRPDLVKLAFADLAPELLRIVKAPIAKQIEFADSISIGPKKIKIAESWLSSFARFGRFPEVDDVQLRRAREKYFEPAQATAARLGLGTELGLAVCFDIQVQNGGVKRAVETKIKQQSFRAEKKLRVALANAVADSARAAFREDVRSRKMTLATGAGKVDGVAFNVPNWGLDDIPVS